MTRVISVHECTDLRWPEMNSALGSITCPLSSTALEMLNVERTVAIVINTVASAKYRPGHILKDSELTTTPHHRIYPDDQTHLLPKPKASPGYSLVPGSDFSRYRSGLKVMGSG